MLLLRVLLAVASITRTFIMTEWPNSAQIYLRFSAWDCWLYTASLISVFLRFCFGENSILAKMFLLLQMKTWVNVCCCSWKLHRCKSRGSEQLTKFKMIDVLLLALYNVISAWDQINWKNVFNRTALGHIFPVLLESLILK